ncbi:MAG: HPr family phosphocarrier protein, partial [Atopobium minutum]|nr:HPr family phosphocarrier protein [Atopobium minutum]
GLHIGPAMTFSDALYDFPCKIGVISQGKYADAKRPLALLGIGIPTGSEIEIVCDGEREDEALATALDLINKLN